MVNTNLTVRKGQCINFGNCSKANAKEVIEVNLGDDFICPECEGGLIEIQPKVGFPPALKWILIIVSILVVLGVGGWFGYKFVFENSTDNKTELSDTHFIHEDFPIPVEGITLDKTSLSFEKAGTIEQLTATIQPENVLEENKKVIWRSSDETVVTVDSTGLVTTVSNSNAVISAYTLNGLEATCSVTVKGGTPPPPIPCKISVPGGTYTGELKNGKPHGIGTITYNSRTLIDERDMKKRYVEAGQYLVGQFRNGRLMQGKLFDKSDKQIETIIIGGGVY